MGLLDYFKKYYHSVDIYSLVETTGAWGTTEKETYTKTKTISAYIQPLSGSEILKNQSLDNVTTHRMYIKNNITLLNTDRIVYNSRQYHITYNQDNGVANIGDHKEIMLVLQR